MPTEASLGLHLGLDMSMQMRFGPDVEWVKEINGEKLETYIDWMSVCCMISVTGLPAISIPHGQVNSLPVGLQLIGNFLREDQLLNASHVFQQNTDFHLAHPNLENFE